MSIVLIVVMDTTSVQAYTSPGPVDLGTAANFAVLANTAITNSGNTVVTGGDVGSGPTGFAVSNFPPGIVTAPATLYTAANAATANANNDLNTAYLNLAGRTPDQVFLDGDAQLNNLTLEPGIYQLGSATSFQLAAGNLTLDAVNNPSAIWIFQVPGATDFKTAASTQILLSRGAQACNIYWQVGRTAILGASSLFRGNILANTSITVGNSVTVNGRLLAGAVTGSGAITLDTDTITQTACSTSSPSIYGYLTVIKTVINNNGGTKIVSDFPLFIGPTNVISSVAYAVVPDTYAVTETNLPGYSASVWGGACSPSGIVTLVTGDNKVCTITNDDIAGAAIPVSPPLISIEKLPSPLSLPAGSGLVTYTYTVSNIGPVPIELVTVIDNKCALVTYISGDTNSNSILGLTEIWTYRCAVTVGQTTTNSATAVGYSGGISTTDIAFATVVVGTAASPPLIHVVKTPDRFVVPFGGGLVTYTYEVTNPGFVALRNVTVVDDRCTNISGHTGDTDRDNLLDATETWTFTCQMNIRRNTVNTVATTGRANGLTATDFALATVVVAPAGVAPGFPNTGIGPEDESNPWRVIAPLGIIVGTFLLLGVRRRQIR